MSGDILTFDKLPELPQVPLLKAVAVNLWQQPGVVALWLDGSLARLAGDPYSDIDLRVAVENEYFTHWETPKFERLFGYSPLAHHLMRFGDTALLHHLLATNGDIYDLYIQTLETSLSPETRLVLGCRDETFLTKLLEPFVSKPELTREVTPESIRQMLEFYWLNAHKHRKALYRNLDLPLWQGINFFLPDLIRLYYILLTEKDCGDLRQITIHAMTPVVRVLQTSVDARVLEVVSLPTRTKAEKLEAVDRLNTEVSIVGHLLANKYRFEYPNELESLVLEFWQMFKAISSS